MNRKAVELSINTIIIIVLALVALIVLLLIFSSSMRQVAADIALKVKSAFSFWNATGIKP